MMNLVHFLNMKLLIASRNCIACTSLTRFSWTMYLSENFLLIEIFKYLLGKKSVAVIFEWKTTQLKFFYRQNESGSNSIRGPTKRIIKILLSMKKFDCRKKTVLNQKLLKTVNETLK